MAENRSFKNMLVVGGGGFLAQFIQVAATPILTRLYEPSDYAAWAILVSLIAIFASIATLRFELAIVLPDKTHLAARVFLLSTIASFLIAIVTIPLILIFGPALLAISKEDILWQWIWIVPILIAVNGVYQSCVYWFIRNKHFKNIAIVGIWLTFATALTQIVAAFSGRQDSVGLIIGTLVGQSTAAVLSTYLVMKLDGWNILRRFTLPDLVRSFKTYITYPKYMTPYTMMGVLRERLTIFFFNSFGTSFEVGNYAFSSRIANLPVGLVSNGVRPILYQSAASEEENKSTEKLIEQILNFLVKIAVPIWILVLFEAEELFAIIFGEAWREAAIYGKLLSIPAMLLLISNWMDRLFDVHGKQKLAFKLEVVFSILSIGSFLLGYYFGGTILIGLSVQVVALVIYYLYFILTVYRISDFKMMGLVHVLRTSLLSAAGFSALILLLQQVMASHSHILLLTYSLFILAYFIFISRDSKIAQRIWRRA